MGIHPPRRSEWAGENSRVVRPVSGADCAKFPTFDELVAAEGAALRGVSIRGGVAHLEASVEELAVACEWIEPYIDEVIPPFILFQGEETLVKGSAFGAVKGTATLWLSKTADLITSPIKRQYTIDAWGDEEIEGRAPSTAGMYVWAWVFVVRPPNISNGYRVDLV